MTINVVGWTSPRFIPPEAKDHGCMGGFFSDGMRWQDYIKNSEPADIEYAEAIRASVTSHKLKIGGDEHQTSAIPMFSDGSVASYSFRGWGDLMAAIWAEEENKDYNYMDFYCCYKEQET